MYLTLLVLGILFSPQDIGAPPYRDRAVSKDARVQDRLLVGNAALLGENNQPSATWLPDPASGADWILKNSTIASMPETKNRLIAVSGTSKTSLGKSVAIGLSGAIINDAPDKTGWALYSDVQHEQGRQSFGLEVAAKNVSAENPVASPYLLNTGVYGVWLAGWGDDHYGGKPTHPSNAAIAILSNASTWNRGIVFENNGITGTDGVHGTGIAIEMAKGHMIQWRNHSGAVADIGIEGDDDAIDIVFTPSGKTGRLKTPRLNISDIPISAAGLEKGDVWNDHGTLKIIP